MPKNTKGPMNGKLIATFTGPGKAGLSREQIKNTSILVLLSIIANDHCQNDSLQATIERAVEDHKETYFLMGDEPHWHNLKQKLINTEEEILALKQAAIALGDAYLEKNLPYFLTVIKKQRPDFDSSTLDLDNKNIPISEKLQAINAIAAQLKSPFHIYRWNEWVTNNKHQFAEKQLEITSLYQSVPILQESLDTMMNQFVQRHITKTRKVNPAYDPAPNEMELLRTRSRGYLNEESPAIFYIAAELGINFVAYPDKMSKLFQETKRFFITPKGSTSAHSLSIQVDNPSTITNWLQTGFKRKKPAKQTSNNANMTQVNALVRTTITTAKPNLTRSTSCNLESLRRNVISEGSMVTAITSQKTGQNRSQRFFHQEASAEGKKARIDNSMGEPDALITLEQLQQNLLSYLASVHKPQGLQALSVLQEIIKRELKLRSDTPLPFVPFGPSTFS